MYIIGTSTLSELILDVSYSLGIAVEGFFDDFSDKESFGGIKIIGGLDQLLEQKHLYKNAGVFVAIGNNTNRHKLGQVLTKNNIKMPTLIHPAAYVEPSARLGAGNLILGGAYIGSQTIIGDGNLIFPGTCLSHHNRVGHYNFFSPNVSVGGYARISSTCKIGMNSVVQPYIQVASGFECQPLTVVTGEKIYD